MYLVSIVQGKAFEIIRDYNREIWLSPGPHYQTESFSFSSSRVDTSTEGYNQDYNQNYML